MEYIFNEENFEKEVLQSELPVLVDFYADWCGPCKMMGPVIAEIAEEYAGKVKVGKCNVDESMEIAMKYRVMSIPNFVYFKDGSVSAQTLGAMDKSELLQTLGIL